VNMNSPPCTLTVPARSIGKYESELKETVRIKKRITFLCGDMICSFLKA